MNSPGGYGHCSIGSFLGASRRYASRLFGWTATKLTWMSAPVVIRTWFLCCHIIFGGGAVVTSQRLRSPSSHSRWIQCYIPVAFWLFPNYCKGVAGLSWATQCFARTFTECSNVGKQVEDSLSRFLPRGRYALQRLYEGVCRSGTCRTESQSPLGAIGSVIPIPYMGMHVISMASSDDRNIEVEEAGYAEDPEQVQDTAQLEQHLSKRTDQPMDTITGNHMNNHLNLLHLKKNTNQHMGKTMGNHMNILLNIPHLFKHTHQPTDTTTGNRMNNYSTIQHMNKRVNQHMSKTKGNHMNILVNIPHMFKHTHQPTDTTTGNHMNNYLTIRRMNKHANQHMVKTKGNHMNKRTNQHMDMTMKNRMNSQLNIRHLNKRTSQHMGKTTENHTNMQLNIQHLYKCTNQPMDTTTRNLMNSNLNIRHLNN
ncbi:uncharacterized protein ISCGN_002412 [Ixodes scapularis]